MISKTVIFGSIAFSLAISVIGIITQNPKEFENSRFGIFIKILSSLAFILVAMGLILTAQAFEESQKLTITDQTFKLIDRSYLEPVSKMRELYPKCPNFVKSLWPQMGIFNSIQNSVTPTNKIDQDDNACILDISVVILQCFEDHFTGSGFDATGEIVWAGNFLQWTSSDKLYEMWKVLYPNYKETTNAYAKLLFEYANKGGKIKDSDELNRRCIEFSKDKRLEEIFARLNTNNPQ